MISILENSGSSGFKTLDSRDRHFKVTVRDKLKVYRNKTLKTMSIIFGYLTTVAGASMGKLFSCEVLEFKSLGRLGGSG